MRLTERQKKFLRREAHALKPLLAIGDKGVTQGFLDELHTTLEYHELLKIRVRAANREERDSLIDNLTETMHAVLIGRIGNVATLYRARRKNPGITLPAPG